MTAADPAVRPGLPELAGEYFTFVMSLQSGPEPGDGVELRERAVTLLREFADRARRAGIPQDATDHSRFVMVALLDEVVMTSNWAVRDDWSIRPLAYELFDDLNAGENVYTRLEELRRQGRPDDATIDALEIYVTALCLGFRGRHGDLGGHERVRDLIASTGQRIAEARGAGEQLSPHWQPQSSVRAQLKKLPGWWLVAGALILVAVIALILELMQSGYWAAALQELKK